MHTQTHIELTHFLRHSLHSLGGDNDDISVTDSNSNRHYYLRHLVSEGIVMLSVMLYVYICVCRISLGSSLLSIVPSKTDGMLQS